MIYLGNAFSLGMLPEGMVARVRVVPVDVAAVRWELKKGFESAVGHQSTADVFADILDVPVTMKRLSVKLNTFDTLIVGQYSGPRLAEGVTKLPEGAEIQWFVVTVSDDRLGD